VGVFAKTARRLVAFGETDSHGNQFCRKNARYSKVNLLESNAHFYLQAVIANLPLNPHVNARLRGLRGKPALTAQRIFARIFF
jgi:muconolactone delta-isomerase